jgi:hypothetical protein
MDLDVIQRQVADLMAFKARIEPLIEHLENIGQVAEAIYHEVQTAGTSAHVDDVMARIAKLESDLGAVRALLEASAARDQPPGTPIPVPAEPAAAPADATSDGAATVYPVSTEPAQAPAAGPAEAAPAAPDPAA